MLAKASLVVGALLMSIGGWGYLGTGTSSLTALIPAMLGATLVVLSIPAVQQRWGSAGGWAALLALVGFFATVSSLPELMSWLANGFTGQAGAAIARGLMALSCGALVVTWIGSFVTTRRRTGHGAYETVA